MLVFHLTFRLFYNSIFEFFRALLYGGLRESHEEEVEIKDTNLIAFKVLLRYIYTGHVSLSTEKVFNFIDFDKNYLLNLL